MRHVACYGPHVAAIAAKETWVMPKKNRPESTRLRGKLLAFNVSPKGQIEGALIKTANGTAQVNFPKRDAESRARTMTVGSTVDLNAELETEEFEHPVYVASEMADEAELEGKVVRLNYALHGEANGFHLDDGTFVHLKPEGFQKCGVKVGERVTATGSRRLGVAGPVLEARTVARTGKAPRERALA
jgi:hypothetical protein